MQGLSTYQDGARRETIKSKKSTKNKKKKKRKSFLTNKKLAAYR